MKAAAKAKKGLDAAKDELRKIQTDALLPPTLKRYKTNDGTVEKLGEILRENPAGLLVLRDELVGLLASWEREGHEGDRAFFLESWNGTDGFDTDRIGRGSIFIDNLCLSIFGGIQPDKLTGYLESTAHNLGNDGMLQRFQMLVFPDHRTWEWKDRYPNKEAKNKAFSVYEAFSVFVPEDWGATPADEYNKFPFFRFDRDAQALFVDWSADLHLHRLPAEEHPIISQHLGKYDKLFPTLALLFHLIDCVAIGSRGPVGKVPALRAAA